MDMIERKKKIMMMLQSQPQPQSGYVTDGLVLWLDGIDKGNTADVWTDKISGYEFAAHNGVTFGTDYIQLNKTQSQYLDNGTFTTPGVSDGTIELVISGYPVNTTQIIYLPTQASSLAMGIYAAGVDTLIWSSGSTNKPSVIVGEINTFRTISCSDDYKIVDGQSCTSGSNNGWSSRGSVNYIGRRSSGNYYDGKIHSLRIYNRKLTESEVLQNQRYDNTRFNLGLTI